MFNLKAPCKDCPFKPAVKFPLGRGRRRQIMDSLSDDLNTFPCHKTTQHDDDGEFIATPNNQHCVGALIVLEKMRRPNVAMRIGRSVGLYHPDHLSGWDEVYNSLSDFASDDL